ncbi:MAG: hypothetical protein M1827_002255 [Pycnora praestabilis]|nr:MAG: hypothetical protein M1827_002255 [Pycnora praestabilis]
MDEEDDEEYYVPLQDQRVFGAGIKRKRVQFVPSAADPDAIKPPQRDPGPLGDRYLSIVLPKGAQTQTSQNAGAASGSPPGGISEVITLQEGQVCEVCNLPIPSTSAATTLLSKTHEASLAHQVCLEHSHPPSHIDRNRPGLKYLSAYGWDLDSRLGLGATGDGIRIPIKGKVKNDTVGLGVKAVGACSKGRWRGRMREEKLNAKEVRKREEQGKKKRDMLQEMFYRSDDLEQYLGPAR